MTMPERAIPDRSLIRTAPAPRVPAHLSKPARAIWRSIVTRWELDPGALLILRGGLEAWDVAQRARAELAKAATLTIQGDTGVARQHPAAKLMLDSSRESRLCFQTLGLELPDPDRAWSDAARGRKGSR